MNSIAAAALGWVGTPFRWEQSLRGEGCDCRGLLTGVARDLGRPEAYTIEANVVGYSRHIDESALLMGLDKVFSRRPASATPQPGDVLAFRIGKKKRVQHLGLWLGDGRFAHAYSLDPARVISTPMDSYWLNRLAGVWAWR